MNRHDRRAAHAKARKQDTGCLERLLALNVGRSRDQGETSTMVSTETEEGE